MRIWIGFVFVVAALLMGCGTGTLNEIVPVEGRIAFEDGAKIPPGTQLLFSPTTGGTGSAVATVDEDGSFRTEHATGTPGADTGKYLIQLRAPAGQEGTFYKMVRQEYYDPGALTAEVAKGSGPLEFKVAKR